MLSVEVQKATGLKDTQTFGAQDPYLKVSLHAARGTSGVGTAAGAVQAEGSGEVEAEASDVGEQLPGCVATTGTAPGGGVAPVWSDDTQGGTQLPVDRCLLGTSPRARVLSAGGSAVRHGPRRWSRGGEGGSRRIQRWRRKCGSA